MRMAEINRIYGKSGATKKETPEERQARKAKARQREDQKEEDEQPDFESGFDHGFESMATFNGRDVGKDEGPAVTASTVGQDSKQQPNNSAAA